MSVSLILYLYLLPFLAAGILLARCACPKEDIALLIPLGCGFSVSLLAALPGLFAVFLGFRLPAVLLAGLTATALALALALRKHTNGGKPSLYSPPSYHAAFWLCILPLMLVSTYLLHTHILRPGSMLDYRTGQSCYGDMAMHLAFIKSIAVSGKFPPIYPLLGGEHPFGYPFLCETVSSAFLVLVDLPRLSYILPMLPALLSVFGMMWHLAHRMLGSAAKASLAYWLFFMGSGFGFVYFLESPEKFRSIFTAFYNTPTNYTQENILWVNPIVDLLIPQRATLFGWSVLFPALYLLWRFAMERQPRLWPFLTLLVLPLPLLHAHSAVALVLLSFVSGVYTLAHRETRTREFLLPWTGFTLCCAAVWLWLCWGTIFAQTAGGNHMLRTHFNWVNNQNGVLKDPYLWFYIKNIGLVYLLRIPAFFHAGKRQKWFCFGGTLIWALAECVLFQPNPYDNNKLLFVWHLLGCILVASLVCDLLDNLPRTALRAALLAGFCFLGTFGSVLTVGREAVSDYQVFSAEDILTAAVVDSSTDPDALFLTADNHLVPVSSLAGRRILCGSGSFVFYHGMDYSAEYNAMLTLYQTPSEELLKEWSIDYAVFDRWAESKFACDEDWYRERYPLWFENGSCRIYQITPN